MTKIITGRPALITNIATLLQLVEPEEVDDVLKEARLQFMTTTNAGRYFTYATLFDQYLKRMKVIGIPLTLRACFEREKNNVVSSALKMTISRGNIPFVPVLTRDFFDLQSLMNMLDFGKKPPKVHDDVYLLKESGKIPRLYFMFNVDLGLKFREIRADIADKKVEASKRAFLTAHELVSTMVFHGKPSDDNFFIDAMASTDGYRSAYFGHSGIEPYVGSMSSQEGRYYHWLSSRGKCLEVTVK